MGRILVTGGTVFVSRAVAEYFVKAGNDVYVLNRGTREQIDGVKLFLADRHSLGETLQSYNFDTVIDVTAYTGEDVKELLTSLGKIGKYILISSSAVYPEILPMPFSEVDEIGANSIWGSYGTNKIEAEKAALSLCPDTYIIRPPYLYGKYNNVYREAFVFDCAMQDRVFYIPDSGEMKLQFFSVNDLCKFIELIIEKSPKEKIYNVGNGESISVYDWVSLCYKVCKKDMKSVSVKNDTHWRMYFPFYNYEYELDVSRQKSLMAEVSDMEKELIDAYEWYKENQKEVVKKPYIEFIDGNLC